MHNREEQVLSLAERLDNIIWLGNKWKNVRAILEELVGDGTGPIKFTRVNEALLDIMLSTLSSKGLLMKYLVPGQGFFYLRNFKTGSKIKIRESSDRFNEIMGRFGTSDLKIYEILDGFQYEQTLSSIRVPMIRVSSDNSGSSELFYPFHFEFQTPRF